MFTLQANACIVSINDSETTNSDDDTTTDGTADADAGDGDGDSAGDGDGDSGSSGDGDGDSAGDGDGDSAGDGDGDCEPYGNPGAANDQCCEGESPLTVTDVEGSFCSPGCSTSADCPTLDGLDAQCVLGSEPGELEMLLWLGSALAEQGALA